MFDQLWIFILYFFEIFFITLKNLPRDLTGLFKLIRHHALLKYNAIRKRDFIAIFRQNVERYKSKPCFILDERTLSFQEVCRKSENKFHRFFF
jgi:hypothetical protein